MSDGGLGLTPSRLLPADVLSPPNGDPAVPMPSLKDFMWGGERRLPRGPLPSMSPLEAWMRKPQSGLRVTWLGHSTTLIEIDGARLLTDPVWGERASPSRCCASGGRAKRPISGSPKSMRWRRRRGRG